MTLGLAVGTVTQMNTFRDSSSQGFVWAWGRSWLKMTLAMILRRPVDLERGDKLRDRMKMGAGAR